MLIAFGLAIIGAELATVFTNAMMVSLVSDSRLGTLSGFGWATGYVGGLISLALVAGFLVADLDTGKTLLGLPPIVPLDPATREGDRLVGPFSAVWYLVFVLPLFLFTPDRATKPVKPHAVKAGLTQLIRSVQDLVRHHGQVALFLLARMIYADGLGAVYAFGGIYAATVFGWGAVELGLFGIVLTIAATFGAVLGGLLDDRAGSKRVIAVTLLLFIAASIGVLSVDRDHVLFVLPVEPKLPGSPPFSSPGEQVYLAFATLIGLASGPIQASSRTLLARMCPPGKVTEFFGFFSFSGKITAFAAPLLIGVVTHATGSQRIGIATSLAFLVAGLLLLCLVLVARSRLTRERIERMGMRVLDGDRVVGVEGGSATLACRLDPKRRRNVRCGAGNVGSRQHAWMRLLRRRKRQDVVHRLTLRRLLRHQRRRGRRRQRLEQGRMIDQLRHRPVPRHDDIVADRGDLEQLGRKGEWQPDAAMRGRISGNHASMQRRAGPGDPVHERHRRAAINVGVMESLLLEDAENASLGGMAGHAGRDLGRGDQRRAAIDIELLLLERNHQHHRLGLVEVGDAVVGRRTVRLTLLGVGRRRSNGDRQRSHAQPCQKGG